jgi:thiol-disulfide isomerase/thioredoxin
MGQDKVFLFLFQNYYSKGDTSWLTAKQREFIFNRAYSLITNQIGEPAPVLDLIDTAGKPTPLYNVKGNYTFVIFWDPNCGHCKEEVPRIDSLYKAKWKALGVQIYAVNVAEAAIDEWKKYINEHNLKNWKHVYQAKEQRSKEEAAGQPNFRQLYDVFQTPTMYLLDSDKRIIAKRLSIEQFDEVMQAKLKNQTTRQK